MPVSVDGAWKTRRPGPAATMATFREPSLGLARGPTAKLTVVCDESVVPGTELVQSYGGASLIGPPLLAPKPATVNRQAATTLPGSVAAAGASFRTTCCTLPLVPEKLSAA